MSEIKNNAITEEQLGEIAGGAGITKAQAMKVLKYVGISLAGLAAATGAAYGVDKKFHGGKGLDTVKGLFSRPSDQGQGTIDDARDGEGKQ